MCRIRTMQFSSETFRKSIYIQVLSDRVAAKKGIKIILTSIAIQRSKPISHKLNNMKTTVRRPSDSARVLVISYLSLQIYFLSACSAVFAQIPVLFNSYTNANCAGGVIVGTTIVNPGDCTSSASPWASSQYRGIQFDNNEQNVSFYSDENCLNEITGVTVEVGDGYNCFTFNEGQAQSAKWFAQDLLGSIENIRVSIIQPLDKQ